MAIVYIHKRKDIEDPFKKVFYVGIAKNISRSKNKFSRSKFWKNIVNKYEYEIEITHQGICWEEACSIEKYLISFYGRKNLKLGNLCNLTDGGDGATNTKDTPERRKNRIEIAKEVNNREGARSRMSLLLKKATSSLEVRKRMSETAKEIHKRINHKENLSKISKLMHANLDFKEKHRLATKKALSDLAVREKISISGKIAQNRPEVKSKTSVPLKKIIENKNLLEKRNNAIKKAWENRLVVIGISKCQNPRCNNEFEQKRSFQKYCSYKCGSQHHKIKNKNKNG